ncbi:phosphoglycerate mutase GpmB [Candidatus Bilamarchaeum dharawalense]|uniref:Phosphoglycerate mutase GpmB n=1 Tax=Candidatus Bilamarchaeum dharawalense TaxID=2885759 RepID=A0A5E4LY66_9ARCH|nr:phosphoglycerate mutase GpmB [Candidatus Bilamarchaeum dharawalense]
MVTKVYLIRHCQSRANAKRQYSCSIKDDLGLSDVGKIQAKELAQFFTNIKLGKIYSSPFLRTRQTADAIARLTKTEIGVDDLFREPNCGEWNGRTEDEIREKFPEAWRGWHYDPQNNPIPGGESLLEIEARVLPQFQRLVRSHPDENIAIVTHYCVFNVVMCSLFSSLANFRSFDTTNASVAEISMENVPRLKKYISPVKTK